MRDSVLAYLQLGGAELPKKMVFSVVPVLGTIGGAAVPVTPSRTVEGCW